MKTLRIYIIAFIFLSINFKIEGQSLNKKSRALFFACNEYDYKENGITNLSKPISDAKSIGGLLKELDFEIEIVENPTDRIIQDKIENYQKAYETRAYDNNGQLLIFFSGHGMSYKPNGFFLARNSIPKKRELNRTAIEYDYLRTEINDISCKHILVAIDACHSTSFAENYGVNSRGVKKPRRAGRKNDNLERAYHNHNDFKSRIFITSDAEDKSTPDNSSFAQLFYNGLEALLNSNELFISSEELYANYMDDANPQPGMGYFGKNEIGGNFLFFNKPKKEKKLIPELDAWRFALKINTVENYTKHINDYPNGTFLLSAKEKRKDLITFNDYKTATYINTIKSYKTFIEEHPESEYVSPAKLAVERLMGENKNRSKKEFKSISIEINTIPIAITTFQMGGNNHIITSDYTHNISLDKFEIGKYEVTFEEYDFYCDTENITKPRAGAGGRGKMPVVNVSWYDAIAYCNWLSRQKGLIPVYTINGLSVHADFTATGYRLPTEAEWECAASYTGKKDKALFGNGASIADPRQINFDGSQSEKKDYSIAGINRKVPVIVGSLNNANALGLYDMSGNAKEWCWDWYKEDYYKLSPTHNPTGYHRGLGRVVRGGDYTQGPSGILTTKRGKYAPKTKNKSLGFRIARTLQ